ncbi:FkbM family methyltransferase [Nostoc sp. 106C]|jgi:FkbM family methyltransferase|uniref:FkbM family methyltransferase n=1 Tax=Nostoc sp. 106C TaxID=1932667 RepID=UPI000A38DE5D|nr:FkbM family methyltransferase [Nostoc sp. 106C]
MKTALKNFTRKFGIDIVRYYPTPLERAKAINFDREGSSFLKLLTLNSIDLMLDVGANTGQFGKELYESGYDCKVVSFEPLSSAYLQLVTASQSHPQWIVAERCAIGDINGEIEINISNNSQSSSILPMLQAHLDAAPQSAYVGSEKVKIYRLSDIAGQYIKKAKATFLKVDVQGFEDQVLAGAEEILPNIQGIQLEMSFVPLYKGEILFDEMLIKMKNLGFKLYNIYPGFTDYRTGRMLQAIGIFFKGN